MTKNNSCNKKNNTCDKKSNACDKKSNTCNISILVAKKKTMIVAKNKYLWVVKKVKTPGQSNGCAWHCGLSGQGSGTCRNVTSIDSTDSGEVLVPTSIPAASTDPREERCSCEPSQMPVVTNDYFSQDLDQVTKLIQSSIHHFTIVRHHSQQI